MAAAVIFFFFEGGGILTSKNDNTIVKENRRHKYGELKQLGLTSKPFTTLSVHVTLHSQYSFI